MSLSKEAVLMEYAKCMRSTAYALKTYLQTYDNTVSKYVPLELFPDQISLVEDYENYNENIALKYRQAGVSTVTAAWSSKKLVFAKKNSPEKVLIIANKLDTAVEVANKIRGFTDQWPSWVGVGFSSEKNSQRHFKLTNGCEVKAVATSKDALRGYTPTILIFDEAAYIEADSDFWAACMASLSTGGKVIVVSTPNGYDAIYYEIYDQALKGMNEFKVSEMVWWKDPRYAKDLSLVNVKDIIHYYLNRNEYPNVEIIEYNNKEKNFDEIRQLISQGYKPNSSWYESMVKKLKYDKRKVNQELECAFLGSGDNVFNSDMLEDLRVNMVKEPPTKMMGGGLWIWKEPEIGKKYIMGVDVSRGDSEDFSTFQIVDFDTREQVAEYVGKLPPDTLAEICYKWGNMYNAFIVVDITGGMGVTTSLRLRELGYRNVYVDGVDISNKWQYDPKATEKIPGINFNAKRVQIIATFEEYLRHGFKINSSRLLNEMNTFIYVNGRPDHQKGQHDDLIMSVAMALYVGETSFSSLNKVTNQTKAMIDSWTVNTNEFNRRQFTDPVISHQQENFKREATKSDYENYLWLFGGRR
ncbi:large terminase protein [uncultured Caudovirales phage]|uniref:Large terminase protein n=1 Tax=uncultured Caudovirales phage TaxID=2100421 RepID=A0A6J5LA16_9CAUD|nr:large terminase protein [uncultured Caudovirales phage]